MKQVAVVLMNLGGPNNADAVQPFLYNLFMDDDIFKIPVKGKARQSLMRFITSRRAKSVVEKYKVINACPQGCMGPKSCSNRINKVTSTCCSATNPITEWQRRDLEKRLNEDSEEISYRVFTAMRYWNPSSADTIEALKAGNFDELVLLPLYPQFSHTTTASSFNEWTRQLAAQSLEGHWKTHMITSYHRFPTYLRAINQRIEEGMGQFPEAERDQVQLLFSAHGTPISFRDAGDPYSKQIEETVAAVMELRGHDRPHWLSYQSRVGPVKWILPNTEEFLHVLRGYGVRHLLVIPIAFVSDHIETSHEIDIEFREVAEEIGIEHFYLTRGLNDLPLFIDALAELVESKTQHLTKDASTLYGL
jgi:protoporphyrin/coproporphyrin ferrochelatase